MSAEVVQTDALLRQLMIEVAHLPEDDLLVVAEFHKRLKQTHREASKRHRPSVVAIRAEAKRRAAELKVIPREQLVDRFIELMDEIRAEVLAKGIAAEGEWEGD